VLTLGAFNADAVSVFVAFLRDESRRMLNAQVSLCELLRSSTSYSPHSLAGSTQLLTATDFLRNMRVFKKSEADAAKELYPTDHYVM
jgi:hypothetical protein